MCKCSDDCPSNRQETFLSRLFLCDQCGKSHEQSETASVDDKYICHGCMRLMGAKEVVKGGQPLWWITQKFRHNYRDAFGVELPLIETKENQSC